MAGAEDSVNLGGIGPTHQARRDIELLEEPADHLACIRGTAQAVQTGHDSGERPLDVLNRLRGIEIAPVFETALTPDDFLPVKV